MKVISGAQVGADIAGLRAARNCGIETGGFVPKYGKIKGGFLNRAVIDLYGLQETNSEGYQMRTLNNVLSSQATVRIAHNWESAGERLTHKYLDTAHLPHFDVTLRRVGDEWAIGGNAFLEDKVVDLVVQFLLEQQVEVLNIAGNANPEIEECAERFLTRVFQQWKEAIRN